VHQPRKKSFLINSERNKLRINDGASDDASDYVDVSDDASNG
jgi:hypothetical protein